MINNKPKLTLAITLMVFGTIGTISRFINLPSAHMSCIRAFLSAAVIVLYLYLSKRRLDFKSIKKESPLLFLSGLLLSVNWVMMFESFKLTSVAVASLCYYMQPIFLILSAPIFFKEKLSIRKLMCVFSAFCGLILVSNLYPFSELIVASYTESGALTTHFKGVFFALLAAVMYTGNIIVNKKYKTNISAIDSTCSQLFVAGIILIPYILLNTKPMSMEFDAKSICLILILSVVHTGIAYIVYYSSARRMDAQAIAVLSYIDPIVSVLLSVFFLKETMSMTTLLGAVLILGSTYVGSRD